VMIRKDGSLDSAEIISGHPLLKQAALDSAQRSQFECRACSVEVTTYSLAYAFEISGECRFGPNCEHIQSPPKVEQSQGRVAITAEPWCTCDPVSRRVRSAKCFYLWKCGYQEVNQ
ncbi:MAG TPA: hypothetical protein VNX26_17085, partial [Candidatus Acidoferrum sp.]|nr:hypothetical protein [Candidatus Acidoferrum sp.]